MDMELLIFALAFLFKRLLHKIQFVLFKFIWNFVNKRNKKKKKRIYPQKWAFHYFKCNFKSPRYVKKNKLWNLT